MQCHIFKYIQSKLDTTIRWLCRKKKNVREWKTYEDGIQWHLHNVKNFDHTINNSSVFRSLNFHYVIKFYSFYVSFFFYYYYFGGGIFFINFLFHFFDFSYLSLIYLYVFLTFCLLIFIISTSKYNVNHQFFIHDLKIIMSIDKPYWWRLCFVDFLYFFDSSSTIWSLCR